MSHVIHLQTEKEKEKEKPIFQFYLFIQREIHKGDCCNAVATWSTKPKNKQTDHVLFQSAQLIKWQAMADPQALRIPWKGTWMLLEYETTGIEVKACFPILRRTQFVLFVLTSSSKIPEGKSFRWPWHIIAKVKGTRCAFTYNYAGFYFQFHVCFAGLFVPAHGAVVLFLWS